ncbi:MAG TPA: hypothetical protein VGM62_08445 [Chthoniobacterales bacterium]
MNAKRCLATAITVWLLVGHTVGSEEDVRAYAFLEMSILAIDQGDYERFMHLCDDNFRRDITREKFDKVHRELEPRFRHDWSSRPAGNLKQRGCDVYLWILTFKDGGDDLLFRVSVKEGKLAGLAIQ